ncbi:DUF1491 family protein [Sphingomonas sp. SUN019]|uniref:DUF1491 family protein n=1 Tax=Sphingomonas sp. SUN019 TaxID=2937788 RepID=UPI002164E923|nr:DUF1491 family protein [Sphingomonas sp. SUN019]UVO51010.1 DUF1491 family protein [Sphingomonas sp. SUN019]
MNARLPTHLIVGALLRRTNNAGGMGVVRARGDDQGGMILVIADDGASVKVLERGLGPDGNDALITSGPSNISGESIEEYWKRRRARDPDLWIVALDTPDAERFAAETILGH